MIELGLIYCILLLVSEMMVRAFHDLNVFFLTRYSPDHFVLVFLFNVSSQLHISCSSADGEPFNSRGALEYQTLLEEVIVVFVSERAIGFVGYHGQLFPAGAESQPQSVEYGLRCCCLP